MVSATFGPASIAPIGKPPPSALARVTMSGTTSSCQCANSVPVRPMPAWISSSTSSALCWSHSSRTRLRKPDLAGITPPSPWIGSSITAATSPAAIAVSSCTSSLKSI
ncbi:hypothetical protein G6F40_014792 [Rhizopus arrhizus]|nr:hypothetical protein G6F40_014792 [Rhizopus arrhizus]